MNDVWMMKGRIPMLTSDEREEIEGIRLRIHVLRQLMITMGEEIEQMMDRAGEIDDRMLDRMYRQ
jgi:hypothetical protein